MPVSPQAEAIVQLARKRRILDRPGCARLRILLAERKVETATQARQFLDKGKLLPLGPAQQLVAHLPPDEGMLLGAYRVLAHLADGGMGSVWLATRDPAIKPATDARTPMPQGANTPASGTDAIRPPTETMRTPTAQLALPPPGQLVVVKTMKGQFAGVDEVRRRFERECRFMAAVVHPSVVAIRDHGAADDGTLFMVLEFVESGDLKELVEQQGPLPEAMALAFVHQVADALDAAHARKLIHRDIKPANIFASPEGTCQLADFGIARSTSTERTQLTMEGTLVGSPAYMSPEQVLAENDLDIRSDLYALGCVLFYCLTGKEPFRGRLQEVLHAHRTAPIPDPREGRPEITAGTAAIIRRLMAKKREERFQVPAELRQAIAEVLASLGTGAQAMPIIPRATAEDRTITADLLAEGGPAAPASEPGHDSSTDSRPTIMVGANGMPSPDATIAVAAGEWASGTAAQIVTAGAAPAATPKPSATPAKTATSRIEGDAGNGLDQPWIALTGDGCHVLLYGRRQATMGKLCEPPSDVCLRKYPTTTFRDDCLRISRQHLQLRFDAGSGRLLLTDLGSGNGTILDGQRMAPNTPVEVEAGSERRCEVANALALLFRARARQGAAVMELAGAGRSDGSAACGIDCGHPLDVAVIARADNRPGMAYALVLRRATVGGSGSDIVLPGANGPAAEVALFRGRWIWRPAGGPAWKPLADGTAVEAGGKRLRARVGGYDIFQTEA